VAPRLARAAVERVRQELDLLLAAPAPERGLDALARSGALDAVLPELAPLRDCRAGAGRPDVWTHTRDAVRESARAVRLPGGARLREPLARRLLRWALLFHDVAKPETLGRAADGRPTFHGHETLGARRTDRILLRLRLPRAERRRIVGLVALHLRPGHLADAGAPARGLRRLVRDAGEDLPLLLLHAACDARASGAPDARSRWRRLSRVLRRLAEIDAAVRASPDPRLISGHDVLGLAGVEPGPRVGAILDGVREAQREGLVRTREQALALAARLAGAG
jgi:poly(A) polymerase